MKKLFAVLGPGIIYSGAAVGVSHLVQSTRAGASFGFDLIWILLLANILKYPFFEFAPRYANTTGNSLIEGYKKLGNWAIVMFALLTLFTMFAIQAAVSIVTAGLIAYTFNLPIDEIVLCAIILGISGVFLIIGKYSMLDKTMKFIIVILSISTIFAVISAFFKSNDQILNPTSFSWVNQTHIFFFIAFIGWMPSPIDVSVWSSLWSIAKLKQLKFKPKLKHALIDFKIGYIGTTILALGFLLLGALIMYGKDEELSSNGTIFAGQLINMYSDSIGEWAKSIISIAAVTTMFSTTLTCLDAYPRVLIQTSNLIFQKTQKKDANTSTAFIIWISIIVIGTLFMLGYFSENMRFMVDLATTLSFVTAPILAFMNYKVVTDKHMPEDGKPKLWLKIYSWIGVFFLSAFTIVFLYLRFVN